MHAFLKLGILLSIGLRNVIKPPLTGVFHVVPLGICLWIHPDLMWSAGSALDRCGAKAML